MYDRHSFTLVNRGATQPARVNPAFKPPFRDRSAEPSYTGLDDIMSLEAARQKPPRRAALKAKTSTMPSTPRNQASRVAHSKKGRSLSQLSTPPDSDRHEKLGITSTNAGQIPIAFPEPKVHSGVVKTTMEKLAAFRYQSSRKKSFESSRSKESKMGLGKDSETACSDANQRQTESLPMVSIPDRSLQAQPPADGLTGGQEIFDDLLDRPQHEFPMELGQLPTQDTAGFTGIAPLESSLTFFDVSTPYRTSLPGTVPEFGQDVSTTNLNQYQTNVRPVTRTGDASGPGQYEVGPTDTFMADWTTIEDNAPMQHSPADHGHENSYIKPLRDGLTDFLHGEADEIATYANDYAANSALDQGEMLEKSMLDVPVEAEPSQRMADLPAAVPATTGNALHREIAASIDDYDYDAAFGSEAISAADLVATSKDAVSPKTKENLDDFDFDAAFGSDAVTANDFVDNTKDNSPLRQPYTADEYDYDAAFGPDALTEDDFFDPGQAEGPLLGETLPHNETLETRLPPSSILQSQEDSRDMQEYDKRLQHSPVLSNASRQLSQLPCSVETVQIEGTQYLPEPEDWTFLAHGRESSHTDHAGTKQSSEIEKITATHTSPASKTSETQADEYSPLSPFARPRFPSKVLDRSPVAGISPAAVLRTCFRIGEALNQGNICCRENQDTIIELFARVTFSCRDTDARKQQFQFGDIFHGKPPFLSGVLDSYGGSELMKTESDELVTVGKGNTNGGGDGVGQMVRVLGRLRRAVTGKGWVMEVINVRKSDWEEVRWTKKIVSGYGY